MEKRSDPPSLAGFRILVVEDAFLTADDLARELAGWGCEVIGPEGHVETALKRTTGQTSTARFSTLIFTTAVF